MKHLLSVSIFLFLAGGISAQNSDSLVNLVPTTLPDTVQVLNLNNLVWDNIHHHPLQAEKAGLKALDIATRIKHDNSLSDCYNTLGNFYHLNGDEDKALAFQKKAIDIRTRMKDKKGLARSYNNIGNIYQITGKYVLANDYFLKCLKLAGEVGDSAAMSTAVMNIGNTFGRMEQYSSALEYYERGLKFNNTEAVQLDYLLNISMTQYHLKDFTRAESTFNKALRIAEKLNSKFHIARLYSNISQLYLDRKEFARAEAALLKSQALYAEMLDRNGSCLVSLGLAKLYSDLKQYDKVIPNGEKARSLAAESKMVLQERFANFLLATAYKETGNFPAAFDHLYDYSAMNDSILKSDIATKLNKMELDYANSQKEKAEELLKQRELAQKLEARNRTILIGGALAALLLGSLVLYGRFRRFKLQQQIRLTEELYKEKELRAKAVSEAENEERARIAKDIHDDLGSGLSKIRFLTHNLIPDTPPELVPMLDSIAETSTHLVENMRELIWIADPQNNGLDSLVARIREYTTDYLHDFSIDLRFAIDNHLPETHVSREAYRHLFSSVKETLQNIVKHAGATAVQLAIRAENDELLIIITDNGKGFNVGDISNGNGLRNINYRLNKLNGKVLFDSNLNKGTTVKMAVKMEFIKTGNTTLVV